jgi:hypothetical protein
MMIGVLMIYKGTYADDDRTYIYQLARTQDYVKYEYWNNLLEQWKVVDQKSELMEQILDWEIISSQEIKALIPEAL